MRLLLALLCCFAIVPASASAEIFDIRFVGTVTDSADTTLRIRQPDGSLGPWNGPVPDYSYVTGDDFTIAFQVDGATDLPSQSTDGIYRFTVVAPDQNPAYVVIDNPDGVATIAGGVDIGGPISQRNALDGTSGLVLVYDSNNGTYALEVPLGGFSIGNFEIPGYTYNPATSELSFVDVITRPGFACDDPGGGCTGLIGDLNGGSFRSNPVYSDDGNFWGSFDLFFSGDWFVNDQIVDAPDNPPVPVPEPGQMGLFSLALLGLFFVRRRKRAAAV